LAMAATGVLASSRSKARSFRSVVSIKMTEVDDDVTNYINFLINPLTIN
jgi:hypothetical protein